MKQLMFIEPGVLRWDEIEAPKLLEGEDALIRPLAVARCDLDLALIDGIAPFRGKMLHCMRNHLPGWLGQRGIFRNAPLKGPFPLGHESVAEVIEVGPDVKTVKPGDLVIAAFQISCGRCANCLRMQTNACLAVPPRSAFGLGDLGGLQWGGMLTEVTRVPFANHMLTPVPEGADLISLASMSDNAVDGYRAVALPLRVFPEAKVLVVGGLAQSLGLYAAAAAIGLGASSVDYLDTDPTRLEVAARVGANPINMAYPEKFGSYLVTVDASGEVPGLHCAIASTSPGGYCTSIAMYLKTNTPMPLRAMYGNDIVFSTGRANVSAHLPATLELVKSGSYKPGLVTTHVAAWEDAAKEFKHPSPKVVIARSELLQKTTSATI